MFEQMPFREKYPVFRKLAEIGDLRKLSREELERLKMFPDNHTLHLSRKIKTHVWCLSWSILKAYQTM